MPRKDPVQRRAYHTVRYRTDLAYKQRRIAEARLQRERWKSDPGHTSTVREQRLKKLYGFTNADYDRLFSEQGGRCGICESLSSGTIKTPYFAVDHDHKTGRVRGLLCIPCNAALGILERPKVWHDAVAAYLGKEPL